MVITLDLLFLIFSYYDLCFKLLKIYFFYVPMWLIKRPHYTKASFYRKPINSKVINVVSTISYL